ncbi:isopeptide-forming domain-containing fimbrial protein [Bifidobacterium sp. 82T24]|uniref:SpaA isopeptide-forming pilin-related protein n=1 Tax=Bifidobacterium pluvialisilvae TaxID=2834436 RepID=UPI001C599289|nr:SpaA isopeptide-forming pilin-related protein [Bifidobacterium pluvialisilvae]MBW3089025.1 isopeptide-forming domain-containing fimbrial protein [Bifidobacterium pluvialisilvae]
MKLKKLFAGVAAAATLLGGMAFGATANAADGDTLDVTVPQNIEVKGDAVNGHTFQAVLIGAYDNATQDASGNLKNVSVNTPDAVKPAVSKALNATDANWAKDAVYADNPAGYVAKNFLDSGSDATPQWSGTLRNFVTNLVSSTNPDVFAGSTLTATGANGVATFDNLTPGVYVIKDVTDGAKSIPMLVGTKVAGKSFANAALGEVDVKPITLPAPVKTADKTAVYTGDTVKFTLTAKVPNTTGVTAFDYHIKDYTATNESLDILDDPALTVTATKKGAKEATVLTKGADYTVSGNAKSENTPLDINLSNSVLNLEIGSTITVTYSVKVNSSITSGYQVQNSVYVQHDDAKVDGNTVTLYSAEFQFQKIDADDNPVNGAEFVVKNADSKYLKADGFNWTFVDNESDATKFASGEYGSNGFVDIKGVAPGTYTVIETKAPNGFLQSVKPTFTVNVQNDATHDYKKDVSFTETTKFGLVKDSTLPGDKDFKIAKVTNVKSLTELPKTGAAGIAMFVALGVVLAGAAAAVYGKSRRAGSALRA